MSVNHLLIVAQSDLTPVGFAAICCVLGALTHWFMTRNGGGRGR